MSAATENYVEQLIRERDLARRDYEVINKLRKGAEMERDDALMQERFMKDAICHMEAELNAALEREQALAAHVDQAAFIIALGDTDVERRRAWMKSKPANTLTKRDLIKQAEALEGVEALIKADARNEMHGYALHLAAGIVSANAAELRQQAAALDGKGE